MDLRETGWEGVDWIHLAQERERAVGSSGEHGIEPSSSLKAGEVIKQLSDSQFLEGFCPMGSVSHYNDTMCTKPELNFIKYLRNGSSYISKVKKGKVVPVLN
jgi:hypothetical protein